MPMDIPAAITAVSTLLTKVFGFAVDQTGLAQLKRENLLKLIMRGIDAELGKQKPDYANIDGLFLQYEQLRIEAS